MSRKFGKWIIAMPGDKGSKIDAKIRQGAVPSKAIEIIVKLKKLAIRGGRRGLERAEKSE